MVFNEIKERSKELNVNETITVPIPDGKTFNDASNSLRVTLHLLSKKLNNGVKFSVRHDKENNAMKILRVS